jgi:CRP/FNR family transcriptional regulator, cyclic AMP receptor protein
MDREAVAKALRTAELFQELRPEDLRRLANLATTRSYKPDSMIVKEEDTAIALYCILSGSVRVQRQGSSPDGPVTLAELGPGAVFGEMGLLDDFARSASVVAITATECALLTKWEFRRELKNHPTIGLALLRVLSQRVRALDARVAL